MKTVKLALAVIIGLVIGAVPRPHVVNAQVKDTKGTECLSTEPLSVRYMQEEAKLLAFLARLTVRQ